MSVTRSDLDGQRLVTAGRPDIWLVFHGKRHRIPSSKVYDHLFSESERVITSADVDEIQQGEDLDEGTCLIAAEDGHQVYLVTGSDENIRRYHILNYESFLDFGFDPAKIVKAPEILLRGLSEGEALTTPVRRS